MSDTTDLLSFLSHIRKINVRLTLEGDRLSCSAPKGVLTSEVAAQLKARKEEILEFLRKQQSSTSPSLPAVERINRDGYLAPSAGQQRLWFIQQLNPTSGAYNIPLSLRFRGKLNPDVLEKSLCEIVRRHESLRTAVVDVGGVPQMLIQECGHWKMERIQLPVLPQAEQETRLAQLAHEHLLRPFDLSAPPLIRACLVQYGSEEYALFIEVHHIAADGWSVAIIIGELIALYDAFQAGLPSPLAELPIQYADYAHWYRTFVENGSAQSSLHYWKQKLKAPLPALDLPVCYSRPPVMTLNGIRSVQRISRDLVEQVERFSEAEGVTPFITLLTAFKALLFRYSGQTDLTVGSASAGRSREELEKLVGLFANTLALRTDLSGDPSVRTLLGRVKETSLNALANDGVSLNYLIEVLQPQRDLSRPPLFQVMFVLQNMPLPKMEVQGLQMTFPDPPSFGSRYELTVEALKRDGQFIVFWEYNTDLFDAATIERMQQHFKQLLESLISHPDSSISELQMMLPAELDAFTILPGTVRESYPQLCIHEWFERQASESPLAVAVVCGNRQLTYGELHLRSNQLANRLRRLGVQSGTLVGLCIERSVDAAVALLGVLKAGGAYVPLDPQYPPDRIAFMLEDAKVLVLVTEEPLLKALPQALPSVLCLDRDRDSLQSESEESCGAMAAPEDLAYVIYTSGSTGRPKGVAISHRSVVNFLASMQREPGISKRDTILAVTTLSFDISGLEFYLPLVTGARIVIAQRVQAADGAALANLIEQSGATIMQATPVTWRLLLESGWKKGDLKILCGGEMLPRDLANRMLETGAEVWNLYGPTETTIWSTTYKVEHGEGTVPIGKPIANTQVYVLDANRRPVPIGVAGELYIGGDGLAREYLHRPELTGEKFVPHPFRPGERVYRTGDLARWRPDGYLECIGRIDHQVKLRGYRIELGEIEVILEQQQGVQQAVAVIREDVPGDPRMVAYFTGDPQNAPDPISLRASLLAKLPEYMAPSAFVHLDEFPLTPNKKVDRKALPAPQDQSAASAPYLPPRTQPEREVAEIWQDLLRRSRIGMNDNFFDLGGHSLLVVQLQNRLRQRYGLDISLVELFQRPTVSSLAGLLASEESLGRIKSGGMDQN